MTSAEPTAATVDGDVDAMLAQLLLTPEGRRDPYPLYARVREAAPVHHSGLGFWVVSGFDNSQFVLRDPRFGKGAREEKLAELSPEAEAALDQIRGRARSLLFLDPPDHTRLRGLVSQAFTPRTVERLRPHVERLLDDLLDQIEAGSDAGATDVMEAMAFPLPVTVIGEMLGIPVSDRLAFQPLVRASTVLLEIAVGSDELIAAAAAGETMYAYFVDLLAERRRHPGEDLLSALLAARDGGDALTTDELISTVTLLFGAGFETTTNLIGNGLLALLRHPDELARLRRDRTLMRGAVEELLRYDSPVQLDGRMAMDDVVIGGRRVQAGESVVTLLGASNRDPDRFVEPDRLDLGRDEGPPLSFGSGIHYCLGASLARLEGQVVFGRLLDRFAAMELATDTVDYRTSLTLRGLVELPVRFRAA